MRRARGSVEGKILLAREDLGKGGEAKKGPFGFHKLHYREGGRGEDPNPNKIAKDKRGEKRRVGQKMRASADMQHPKKKRKKKETTTKERD